MIVTTLTEPLNFNDQYLLHSLTPEQNFSCCIALQSSMDIRSRRPLSEVSAPRVELKVTAEGTTLSESDKKRRIWTIYFIGFIVSAVSI